MTQGIEQRLNWKTHLVPFLLLSKIIFVFKLKAQIIYLIKTKMRDWNSHLEWLLGGENITMHSNQMKCIKCICIMLSLLHSLHSITFYKCRHLLEWVGPSMFVHSLKIYLASIPMLKKKPTKFFCYTFFCSLSSRLVASNKRKAKTEKNRIFVFRLLK